MKILITLLLLVSFQALSQTSFTAEYLFTTSEETATVRISKRPGQMAVSFVSAELKEYLIVDSGAKKALELIDETDEDESFKEAYITTWEESFLEEEVLMTFVSELFLSGRAQKEIDYRLLPEKKMILGKECRKVELLDEGKVAAIGWIMPGFYMELMEDFGFMRTEEGVIVEFEVANESNFSVSLKSLTNVASPSDFSFTVPEDYELVEEDEVIDEGY